MSRTILSIIVSIIILTSAVFAQQLSANQIPDLSNSDWQLVNETYGQVTDKLDSVMKKYDNKNQGKMMFLYSVVYKTDNRTEDLVMIYGNTGDSEPWVAVALNVDDMWYVSKVQNQNSLKSSEIKDDAGKVIGIRLSLDSDQGLKIRDVILPN